MSDTFTIKLPVEMKSPLSAEARKCGFKSAAAYVAHLVRAYGTGPIPYEENPELEALLLEGLNSGPGVVADAKYWKDFRRRARAAAKAAKGTRA